MQPGYIQSFESGPTGWQLQDSTSGFRIGNSDTLLIGGNPGRFAAIRSEGHAAGVQVSDYLTSPVIFPGKYSHTAISFDYLFRHKPGIDKLSLVWRDFNTGKWETLVNLDSTGGYSDWRNLHFYLPETPAGTPIQLAFYYNDYFGEGYGAAIDNFMVYEVNEPAVPDLSISQSDICLDHSVIFSDQSVGLVQTWEWDFGEDAEPRYANTQGPHLVSYTKSGKKTIKLSLNHLDHLAMPDALLIRDKPVAGFEHTRRFQDIWFTSKAEYAEQLLWIFGDGTTSEETNPVHTYYTKSLFEVRQIAYNGICQPDTMTVSVDLRNGTGIDDGNISGNLRVFPNPTHDKVTLAWENFTSGPVNIRILSPAGQLFFIQKYHSLKELEIDLSDFPDGLYILQIASGKMIRNEHIIKIK
jgi:PKD repeat protein